MPVCLNPFVRTRSLLGAFKKSLLVSSFIFSFLTTFSQSYYPGGIGKANLIIWLNAGNSSSVTVASGAVSSWADLSGRNFHFTQATTAKRPAYSATAGPNSRPALTFDADDVEYLGNTNIPNTYPFTSGVSSLAVAKFSTSNSSAGYERLYDFGNGSESNNIWMGRRGTTANICYESRPATTASQTYTTTNTLPTGTHKIYEALQVGGTVGANSAVFHYTSGAAQTSNGNVGSSATPVPAAITRTSNYIGRSNWGVDDYYTGTMSEIIFYNTYLNNTRRIILENYLSAAWGLAVTNTIYTPPSSTYYSNLVGIGYISGTDNFLADVAGSTDGLGFSSGTTSTDFLKVAGYISAAHNKQTNSILTNQNISSVGTGLSRWNRSWNIQKISGNSTGYVTLNFHFSDYNGSTAASTWNYGILFNATNGAFSSGTNSVVAAHGITISGNIVSIKVKASQLAAGYYTLVWGTSALLPQVLTSFKVVPQTSANLLSWNMVSYADYTKYEIERSGDGTIFTTIGSLPAKDSTGFFTFTDNAPLAGKNYYRLKITDKDGIVYYSIIAIINRLDMNTGSLTLSSNPIREMLYLSGPSLSGPSVVKIYNMHGQVVKTLQQTAAGSIQCPVQELLHGVYIVQVYTDKAVFTRKIVKE